MTNTPRRNALFFIAACALSTWASGQNSLQTPGWPSKTVKLVVGFPAGSSPDLTARTLAEPLSKALGQPVIVENKVGAGGNIAADWVAKATDNHTLGLMINGNLTTAKLLNPKLGYDPLKDFAPVSLIGVSPLVLMVPKNAPGADARSFLAAAKQAGNSWSYGSPGVGTVGHIGMELLASKTGMAPVHVPYPGYAQVANAMIGGQLQLSMLPPGLALAQVKGDKLRAIGVTSSGRSVLAPELPSMAEARHGSTQIHAGTHRGTAVGAGQRDCPFSRGAAEAVRAGLASGGLVARRAGRTHPVGHSRVWQHDQGAGSDQPVA